MFNNWIVTVTKPDGTKMVVNSINCSSTLGAVSDADAGALVSQLLTIRTLTYKQLTWGMVVSSDGLLCRRHSSPHRTKAPVRRSSPRSG